MESGSSSRHGLNHTITTTSGLFFIFVFPPSFYRFSNECSDHAVTFVKPVPSIFQYLHFYLCQRTFHRQRKCRHFWCVVTSEADVGDDGFSFAHSCSSPLPNTANRNAPMKDRTDAVMKTFLHLSWHFSACLALFVLVILFFFFRKGLCVKLPPNLSVYIYNFGKHLILEITVVSFCL